MRDLHTLNRRNPIYVLLVLSLLIAANKSVNAQAKLQILKVDPSPVQAGTALVVVYSVGNSGSAAATFRIQLAIGIPSNGVPSVFTYQTIPAGGSVVLNWGAIAPTTGPKFVTLKVWEQNGTKQGRICPTCLITTVPVYGNPQSLMQSLQIFAANNAPARPRILNIGPQGETGTIQTSQSESGVINKLAGNSAILYAASTHAGVWRSKALGFWSQLAGAPPRAASIAVDPNNVSHVVVGERGDDKPFVGGSPGNLLASRSGAWESFDAGDTWTKIYDPGLDPNYPLAQTSGPFGAVPAVAFGPYGKAILIGTARGIAVRHASARSDAFVFPSSAVGDVRELAVSENVVWGWTKDKTLLTWSMAAADWMKIGSSGLPATMQWLPNKLPDTVTVTMADQNSSTTVANVQTDCGTGCDRLPQGLAAFDDRAVLVFTPTVLPNHADAADDPNCKPPTTKTSCDIFSNRIGVLVFTSAQSTWTGQLTKDNDGRGLGGRAFAVATILNCNGLPDTVGERRRLYVSSGQGLQEALSLQSDGRFVWDNPVGSSEFQAVAKKDFDGPFGGVSLNLHSDFWDFTLDTGICPPGQLTAWLANDGGIYQGGTSTPQSGAPLSGLSWQLHDGSLWTHNVNALGAVKRKTDQFPHLFYVTGDNDAFWGLPGGFLPGLLPGAWRGGGSAGDAISGLTDGSTLAAVGMRDYWPGGVCAGGECAFISDLDGDPGLGNADSSLIRPFNVGGRLSGLVSSTVFTFIQTTDEELASGAVNELDAVMLVDLPILDPSTKLPIPGTFGASITTPRRVLLRNKTFLNNSDGTQSYFSDWIIDRDNLPPTTERFWVSGGHTTHAYYLFTPDSTTCPGGLMGEDGKGGWTCLRQSLGLSDSSGAISGPAFVNPYRPQMAFDIRLGATPEIEFTPDGGTTFCPYPNLTALITGSGQFPLTFGGDGTFNPSSRFTDAGEAYHGSLLPAISQVAFDRSDSSKVLIVSPLTGVYIGSYALIPVSVNKHRPCAEPPWQSLQGTTDNWGYPSAGVLLDGTAYIGTEGRGVFQIDLPSAGLFASYFAVSSPFEPGAQLATLRSSSGQPIPWAVYTLIVNSQDDQPLRVALRTDQSGVVFMPPNLKTETTTGQPRFLACELKFNGDAQNAPSAIRFNCSPR